MKTRMSNDDIVSMVHSLQRQVCSFRVSNVYDVDGGKTYMLKLSSGGKSKIYLLLESGVRVHTTQYARTKPTIPSQFTMKLRKHIRTKRLTSITQLNGDRVIDFYFGEGDTYGFHVIVELYASGNVILTDNHYTILSLLRIHRYQEEQVRVAVKQVYSTMNSSSAEQAVHTPESLIQWMCETLTTSNKKLKNLKQLLLRPGSGFADLGPSLVEHCICMADIPPKNTTITQEQATLLLDILATSVVELKTQLKTAERGFVIIERFVELKSADDDIQKQSTLEEVKQVTVCGPNGTTRQCYPKELIYAEFVPVLYAQHANMHRIEYDSFDAAVDEYFSKIESQQADVRHVVAQDSADKKYLKIQSDQDARVDALRSLQEDSVRQAQLIELNKQDVEDVLLVVRSALDSGMTWDDLKNVVKMEQKKGNPVANLIQELKYEKKSVVVMMQESLESMEEDDGDALVHLVEIDISKSALANARDLYTLKKKKEKKKKKKRFKQLPKLLIWQRKMLKCLFKNKK